MTGLPKKSSNGVVYRPKERVQCHACGSNIDAHVLTAEEKAGESKGEEVRNLSFRFGTESGSETRMFCIRCRDETTFPRDMCCFWCYGHVPDTNTSFHLKNEFINLETTSVLCPKNECYRGCEDEAEEVMGPLQRACEVCAKIVILSKAVRCPLCERVHYCSRDCLETHAMTHKILCVAVTKTKRKTKVVATKTSTE